MSEERIENALLLNPGDVCVVAVELKDKQTGNPYWWKRFACVLDIGNRRYAAMLTLKLHPDIDKDVRDVDVTQDVVMRLSEDSWPQGVVAMRMKHIALGLIKLT